MTLMAIPDPFTEFMVLRFWCLIALIKPFYKSLFLDSNRNVFSNDLKVFDRSFDANCFELFRTALLWYIVMAIATFPTTKCHNYHEPSLRRFSVLLIEMF